MPVKKAETPRNVVLTDSTPSAPADATQPANRPQESDFPKAVYHKDSKPGALIAQLVDSKEALEALGPGWGPLSALKIETAPAAKE